MTQKIKKSDIDRRRPHGGLRNPLNVNFRVDEDGYEYIARKCHNKRIAEETRRLWFKHGWEKELEVLRTIHRKSGIPDFEFMHPQKRRALFKEQNGHV